MERATTRCLGAGFWCNRLYTRRRLRDAAASCGPGTAQERSVVGEGIGVESRNRHGLGGEIGCRAGCGAGRGQQQRSADANAERPNQRTVQAVAELDLVRIQLRPARAHAAGDVAACQERADLLNQGPKHGQSREGSGRDT
jgi:hypothetical protein